MAETKLPTEPFPLLPNISGQRGLGHESELRERPEGRCFGKHLQKVRRIDRIDRIPPELIGQELAKPRYQAAIPIGEKERANPIRTGKAGNGRYCQPNGNKEKTQYQWAESAIDIGKKHSSSQHGKSAQDQRTFQDA
jgi:hypothetical protein